VKAISLIFGTTNTVAVGTPDGLTEEIYEKSFKPFLTTLYKYPDIDLTVHYTGVLLEWLQDRHPEFIMLINEMVKRGQIEVLGGSYYDTVLPLVPSNDRSAQIEALTTLVRRRFGKRPRGAWITELVWEPGMPSSLRRSGMEYVFLADSHFAGSGLRGAELLEPAITEDQGKTLLVFPVSAEISLFPFRSDPRHVIDRISGSASDSGRRVVSLIADGECFGYWNGSNRTLYDDGWLTEFLEGLRAAKNTIVTTHPRRLWKQDGEHRKRYFSVTSCDDMMKWSLPASRRREFERLQNGRLSKSSRTFLQGGHFRQFLSKYPEANLMYAKTMHANILVNQIRGDKYQKRAAREELWKGESHSAYWHGKRAGIYANASRKAVYSSLILAEKTSRQRGVFKTHLSTEDFDMDGLTEYLYHGNEINMYVHRKGGMVFELDYLAKPWNYLDTLTRIPEIYHDRIDEEYTIDTYPRRAFLDHFFDADEPIDSFDDMSYRELGSFLNRPYTVKECKKDTMDLTFGVDGNVGGNGEGAAVYLEKRYRMKRNAILVDYSIANRSSTELALCFGSEINLSFSSMDEAALKMSLQTEGTLSDLESGKSAVSKVNGFTCLDRKNGVTIQGNWDRQCELWVLPVEAGWTDWSGKHVGYQSTCLVPRWNVMLPSGAEWRASLQLSFARTR
jgi:4-alpha-glucanotransferase